MITMAPASPTADLRDRLAIPGSRLDDLNAFLLDPDARIVNDLLAVVARHGTPDEINRKAREAGALPALLDRVRETRPDYLRDLEWLEEQRERGVFVSVADFRRGVLGDRADTMTFRDDMAVTLEVSSLQYFPWVIAAARRAMADRSLMPGRWIRVRKMREQEADGDLAAVAAAMKIIGASVVETLDTKGTDGSNVHLDGPATITGYFGGVGQPNDHPLLWVDEYLRYYTTYGVRQVLNLNPGTVLAGYLLHRLGVDIEFKISVFMGNDNPFAGLWTLLGAKLFAREDGTTPLVGFNWSNSVDNETLEIAAQIRRALGFEDTVRFEHHITETQKSIVRQPYDRREELIELADHVPNISAKHEGGDPAVDAAHPHPSDILDYFRDKTEVIASGDWDALADDFTDKIDATNHTARALTEHGLSFVARPAPAPLSTRRGSAPWVPGFAAGPAGLRPERRAQQVRHARHPGHDPLVGHAGEVDPRVVRLLDRRVERGARDVRDPGLGQQLVPHEGRRVEPVRERQPGEQPAVGTGPGDAGGERLLDDAEHEVALAPVGGTDPPDVLVEVVTIQVGGGGGHVQGAALGVRRELEEPEPGDDLAARDRPPEPHPGRQRLREAPEVDDPPLGVEALERR